MGRPHFCIIHRSLTHYIVIHSTNKSGYLFKKFPPFFDCCCRWSLFSNSCSVDAALLQLCVLQPTTKSIFLLSRFWRNKLGHASSDLQWADRRAHNAETEVSPILIIMKRQYCNSFEIWRFYIEFKFYINGDYMRLTQDSPKQK